MNVCVCAYVCMCVNVCVLTSGRAIIHSTVKKESQRDSVNTMDILASNDTDEELRQILFFKSFFSKG